MTPSRAVGTPRDFTLDMYDALCDSLREGGYVAQRMTEYLQQAARPDRLVLLRHDVDRRPDRALAMARREASAGLTATYFFRVRSGVLDPEVVRAVVRLGHEVGFHYESVAQARGDLARARVLFARDLARLREHAPVTTASMHGSPLLPWDNRTLWSNAVPADFGLVGEVYRDVDYTQVHYVSDTGRTWHPTRFNVRDRLPTPVMEVVETTPNLIALVRSGRRPRLCILSHPERWSSSFRQWALSAAGDAAANMVKATLARAYAVLR